MYSPSSDANPEYRTAGSRHFDRPRKKITGKCIRLAKAKYGAKVIQVNGKTYSGLIVNEATYCMSSVNGEFGPALQFKDKFDMHEWAEEIGLSI